MRIEGIRVAVTGGAGFIGSHLVSELLGRGNEVTVIDDFSTGTRQNILDAAHGRPVHIRDADVRDEGALKRAFEGQDIVFHLATHCVRRSLSDPSTNHAVNATGTLNALVAARAEKVRRFVYCSSSEVFGHSDAASKGALLEDDLKRPTTLYGASKLAGEHYTLAFHQTYGLESTVLRPFNAYGPRSHLLGAYGEVIPRFSVRIRAGLPPVVFGDGSQTRDFTFVTDTARALVEGAEKDALLGTTTHLAHGKEVSIHALAEMLLGLLGKTGLGIEHAPARPGDLPRLGASVEKARTHDIVLSIGIEEGLKKYLAWQETQTWDYHLLAHQLKTENWK